MTRREDLLGQSWETAWSEKRGILTFCLDKQPRVKGSEISFLTSQQSVETHAGDDLDWVIMDEHHERKYFTENIARLVDRGGWAMLTMTPEAGITWEDEEILERIRQGEDDYGAWMFDSRLNPHLSEEGLKLLIKSLEGNPELFNTKIRGMMVVLSGRVYPMFRRERHVIDIEAVPHAKFVHRQVILDMHLKKASAIVCLGWTREGDVYAYRAFEWKPTSGGLEDLASLIRVKCAGEKINDWIMDEALGGDPNKEDLNIFGEKDVIVQLNDLGLPFVGTNVASDKNVKAGVHKVRQFLRVDPVTGHTRLKISRDLHLLIRQFEIYQFKKDTKADEESYRERIRNVGDDQVTCVRYGIMAEPAWSSPEQIREDYDTETGMPTGPGYVQDARDFDRDGDQPYGEDELS